MRSNDDLHASIAASLVVANLAFTTEMVKTLNGAEKRVFKLGYKVRDHHCVVTGHAVGEALHVLAPIRVEGPIGELTNKRFQFSDFVAEKMPIVRLLKHPYVEPPGDENVIWVEATVPLPPNGAAIEPWLAVTPFISVVAGVDAIAAHFAEATPTTTASIPLFVAGRSETSMQNVAPDTAATGPTG